MNVLEMDPLWAMLDMSQMQHTADPMLQAMIPANCSLLNQSPIGRLFSWDVYNDYDDDYEFKIQTRICSYLTLRDLYSLRAANKVCYFIANNSPSFYENATVTMPASWYKYNAGKAINGIVPWRKATLKKFRYCRNLPTFQNYWTTGAACDLAVLNIIDTTLQCDGLAFILNHCQVLRKLTIKDSRLRHFSYKQQIPNSKSSATDTNSQSTISPPHISPPMQFGTAQEDLSESLLQSSPETPDTNKMRQALKILELSANVVFAPCIFHYLARRTGFLDEFTVNSHELKTNNDNILQEMVTGFAEIMKVNWTTLTKLTLQNRPIDLSVPLNDSFNEQVLVKVLPAIELLPRPQITKLRIGIGQSSTLTIIPQWTGLVRLLNGSLEELSVEIAHPIRQADLEYMVNSAKKTLKTLNLLMHNQGIKGHTEAYPDLDIGPIIRNFEALEKFSLENLNKELIDPTDLLIAQGKKFPYPEPDGQISYIQPTEIKTLEAIRTLRMPLDNSFLPDIQLSVRELRVKQIFFSDNLFSNFNKLMGYPGYRALTKLEIMGPHRTPISNGLELITTELLELEELSLINCGLTDASVTGLRPRPCKILKRLVTQIHSLYGDSFSELLDNNVVQAIDQLLPQEEGVQEDEDDDEEELVGGRRKRRRLRAPQRNPDAVEHPILNPIYLGCFERAVYEEFIRVREEGAAPNLLARIRANIASKMVPRNEVPVEMEQGQNALLRRGARQLHQFEDDNDFEDNELDFGDAFGNDQVGMDLEWERFLEQHLQNHHQFGLDNDQDENQVGNEQGHEEIFIDVDDPLLVDPEEGDLNDDLVAPDPPPRSINKFSALEGLLKLNLSDNPGLTDATFVLCLKNPGIKYLNINGCSRISSATLTHIRTNHTNLEELHLVNCLQLTMKEVNQAVKQCPKLRRIYTSKLCTGVPPLIPLIEHRFRLSLSPIYFDVVKTIKTGTIDYENAGQ